MLVVSNSFLLLGVLRIFFLWEVHKFSPLNHDQNPTPTFDIQKMSTKNSYTFFLFQMCSSQLSQFFVGLNRSNHNWLPWVVGNWRNMFVALSQVGTVCCLEGTWYCLFSVLSSAMVIVTWRCLVIEKWKELNRYVFDVKEETWRMSQTFWRVVIWIILEFTPTWGYDPICLTCFKRVETTN